jgi:acetolactate synthase-1/2/3 large subunit
VGTDSASGVFIPAMESQAKTYRLPFFRCERAADLRSVIDQALAIEGPVIVEINALRDQRMIPSVMSERLPDGRMQSKPLHEMYPYLPQNEVDAVLDRARKAV